MLEFDTAIRRAENLARKRSPKAWLILSFLIPRRRLKYLFLCYAYLREVDNLLDHENINIYEKKKFINGQLQLLTSLNNRIVFSPNSELEAFLFYFLSYSIDNKKSNLIYELKNMLEAMRMDVYRLEQKGIFDADALTRYVTLLNKAMFGLVHSFMLPNDNYSGRYEKIGNIFWYSGTLRDFKKDLNCGYVNISKEDLNEYKIDIEHYNKDENLKVWLNEKITSLLKSLDTEVKILNKLPFRIRLFWSIGYPFYIHKIIRIKMYRYSFDYENKIHLVKEIKSAAASLSLGIKTVLKIVF
jgi:phytoene/squalene synthetase